MNREVEIQVKINNPAEAERKIRKVAKYIKTSKQTDRYFNPPHKNYFAIDPALEYIRVREEKNKNSFEYQYLVFDKKDPYKLITTHEYGINVEKPLDLAKILEKIGLKLFMIVKKERKYFDAGKFLVMIDKVKGLGIFMEIEAKKIIKNEENTKNLCKKLLDDLKIEYTLKHKQGGYPRMLYLKKYKNIKF
jgi:predicted adenylyl cyclase CyaB